MNVIKKLLRKIKTFRSDARLLDGPLNVAKYLYLKVSPFRLPGIIKIRLRTFPNPLGCRPGTTDLSTLLASFHQRYHCPPTALPDNAVILDFGSNVGFTIAEMASTFPNARIIGVEMDEANFRLATENIRPFGPRCTVLNAAVWTEDSKVSYEGKDADAFHIDPLAKGDGHQVVAKTIESLEREYGLDRVDYLKMDIEGAETDIIKKSLKWADIVHSMKIEIHRDGDMAVVVPELERAGFECSPCNLHWSSIVAIRKPKELRNSAETRETTVITG